MKPYSLALHIFRRDLRLTDNISLIQALKLSDEVIPCFIFDTRQLEHNDYKSTFCIQFMAHSLQELNEALKQKHSHLYFFYGIAEEVIGKLLRDLKISAVFINRDYTPFSQKRDQQIEKTCRSLGVKFHCYADALLHEPEEITKPNHQPYTLFTPFFKKALSLSVQQPIKNTYQNYFNKTIAGVDTQVLKEILKHNNENIFVSGGRKEAMTLLSAVDRWSNYQKVRDFPVLDGTTKLSAHNKFGTLSIREFYHAILNHFGKTHKLIQELYWRDFFTHIAFHYPSVFRESYNPKFKNIKWNKNQEGFQAWCSGETGFPMVDAGMRELNTTGYLPNRLRMICGSFLTKDLHIDWRRGEKYFAQKLVDYDPCVNNGNWQWVASTGCDATPYFRIFNPWLQQQKFDPDCLYIKHWVPELKNFPANTIHHLHQVKTTILHYPQPIIDHHVESQRAKEIYRQLLAPSR